MAKLIVTMVDNTVHNIEITPRLEYAFELYAKKGFHKAFRDDEMQTSIYWLSWEGLRLSGVTVNPDSVPTEVMFGCAASVSVPAVPAVATFKFATSCLLLLPFATFCLLLVALACPPLLP